MTLDINDIQGNIIKAYGHFNLPKVRYVFLKVANPDVGRAFIQALLDQDFITRAGSWSSKNPAAITTNIAFTYNGLKILGVPSASLSTFPSEFSEGMKTRRSILGDDGISSPEHWDPIWQNDENIHIWMSFNGRTTEDVINRYNDVKELIDSLDEFNGEAGVELLSGHRAANGKLQDYQEGAALEINGLPTRKEHFGFDDGISDPFFKGCGQPAAYVVGGGKPKASASDSGVDLTSPNSWAPLETGEFILGHHDEASEIPLAPIPHDLSKNGSFMVYRKLHENVKAFNDYLDNLSEDYAEGREALAAKMVGRWKNGAPLASFPTEAEATIFGDKYAAAVANLGKGANAQENIANLKVFQDLDIQLRGFNYNADIEGSSCPMGAHIRRTNPRGALEFGVEDAYQTPGALIDRRRILRRGLPYGKFERGATNDNGDHGIIFMAINASIKRQFEFVQQQWVNYGNDFKLANDRDPILGNHPTDEHTGCPMGRMIIEGSKEEKKAPFFCGNIPRFVETRGGDYFFIPSMTAVQLIANGIVDPT